MSEILVASGPQTVKVTKNPRKQIYLKFFLANKSEKDYETFF
jgi:hypothetical protein